MSTRTDLRDSTAQVALDLLKAFGEQAYLSDHGGASVTLWIDPGDENKGESDMLSVEAEGAERTFFIPKQTSFPPPNGLQVHGAEFTWPTTASYKWQVIGYTADSTGAGYLVRVRRTQGTALGSR